MFDWLRRNTKENKKVSKNLHEKEVVEPCNDHREISSTELHNTNKYTILFCKYNHVSNIYIFKCNLCKKMFFVDIYNCVSSARPEIFTDEYQDSYVVGKYEVLDASCSYLLPEIPMTKENAVIIACILGILRYDNVDEYQLTKFSTDNKTDYAIEFKNSKGDCKGICMVDGVHVPDKWIFEKDSLTINDFMEIENIEKRLRFMILLGDDKIKVIFGNVGNYKNSFSTTGSKIDLIEFNLNNKPIKILKLSNHWDKDPYYLFVPPWINTAKEGVAWSFYQDPTEYNPDVEA